MLLFKKSSIRILKTLENEEEENRYVFESRKLSFSSTLDDDDWTELFSGLWKHLIASSVMQKTPHYAANASKRKRERFEQFFLIFNEAILKISSNLNFFKLLKHKQILIEINSRIIFSSKQWRNPGTNFSSKLKIS